MSEEELEQVSEMLKQSEAGPEDIAKENLEEEYAAAILKDAEGLGVEELDNISAAPSSTVAISNLQSQLSEEKAARQKLEDQLETLKHV